MDGLAKSYQVRFFDEEDGDYIADVPDFKHVSASGETTEEALHEVLIALALAIEVFKEQGKSLPEATCRPEYIKG